MTLSITRKTLAATAAVLLACALGALGLAPQSAHAAQEDGMLLTAQANIVSLTPQAAKKAVSLRTSTDYYKYTYNKYGLITKWATKDGKSSYKLKYKGTKLVKMTHVMGKISDFEYTIRYDSKGRVKKLTVASTGMPVDYYNNTETYYYDSKNRATKKVTTYTSGTPKTTTKYSYYANGALKKIVGSGTTETMQYDKMGSKTKWTTKYSTGNSRSIAYENTYKNGLLVSVMTSYGDGYSPTVKIKYAKKSIPAKYAVAVAQQQKALRQTIPGSVFSWLG